MPLESYWKLETVLGSLHQLRRVDDGGDLLAFRVVGQHPSWAAYVYLYGDDPAAIYYHLEDSAAESNEFDNAVHRGHVRTTQDLREVVSSWLNR